MFKDRQEAGSLLSQKLLKFKKENPILLSIPRGGVVVGKEIAKRLSFIHDILVVRKIGAPQNPELAIGAVGPKRTIYWDEELCKRLGVGQDERSEIRDEKFKEVKEREENLRGEKPLPKVLGKTVIVIDDGVATGATVLAAFKFLKKEKAKKIILAVPVVASETYDRLKQYFDEIIVLQIPEYFRAVGQFYIDFPQVEDEEVKRIFCPKDDQPLAENSK